MASFNRVILLGNLTRDIDLRYTTSGMAIGDVGIAVNDRRKTHSGEWVDEATFVDVKFYHVSVKHNDGVSLLFRFEHG